MSYPKSRIGKQYIRKADLLRDLDPALSEVETELATLSSTAVLSAPTAAAVRTWTSINAKVVILENGRKFVWRVGTNPALDAGTENTNVIALASQPGGAYVITGAVIIVPTLAALAALPAWSDSLVRVSSLGCLFAATPIGTAIADGITVVDGVGVQWLRLTATSDTKWQSQATWYVDAVAGNDEGTGLVGAPVKSFEEIQRRWGEDKRISGHVTILVINAPTKINLKYLKDSTSSYLTLRFVGTTVTTTTISSIANYDFTVGGNRWVNIQAAGIADWTPYVGMRIRFTSNNAVAFVAAVNPEGLGVGTARIGVPYTLVSFPTFPSEYTPVVGAEFVIESFPTCETLDFIVEGPSLSQPWTQNASLELMSVYNTQKGSVLLPSEGYNVSVGGCSLVNFTVPMGGTAPGYFAGCLLKFDVCHGGQYIGCVFIKGAGSRMFSDAFRTAPTFQKTLFQGVSLGVKNVIAGAWLGFFDMPAGVDAIYLEDIAKIYITQGLNGRNNAAFALNLRRSCEILYTSTTVFVLTGASGEITCPGIGNFLWADGPLYFGRGSGTATLAAGTRAVTVKNLPADAKITVSYNTPAGATGTLSVPQASRTNLGTATAQFVINSSSGTDTSTVDWSWQSQTGGEGGYYPH